MPNPRAMLLFVAAVAVLATPMRPALALDEQRTIMVGGFERSYTVFIPDRLRPVTADPIETTGSRSRRPLEHQDRTLR